MLSDGIKQECRTEMIYITHLVRILCHNGKFGAGRKLKISARTAIPTHINSQGSAPWVKRFICTNPKDMTTEQAASTYD